MNTHNEHINGTDYSPINVHIHWHSFVMGQDLLSSVRSTASAIHWEMAWAALGVWVLG
jgi:hypothetical protein